MSSRRSKRATRNPPRIVVVGGNFAGLTLAQHLPSRYATTVVDPSPSFEWLPNIHELVSGTKRPSLLRLPRRRLIAGAGHRFRRDRVAAIDAAGGTLSTGSGRTIHFDICVVAVGGINHTFGVPGADLHAMPFKSVAECAAIGTRLRALARRRGEASIVIVGGGLEGIESLGEILRRYRRRRFGIHLVEAGPRLLPGTPAGLDAAVRDRCAPYGVEFHTDRHVSEVSATEVSLDSGQVLPSDLTIWTGGTTAPPLLHDSGLTEQPRDWAPVLPTLQSQRFDNIFVIGDAAALPDPISKQAFYAMQMGKHAAANVHNLLRGRDLRAFSPSAKPALISLGDLDTYMVIGDYALAGTALAAAKEAVYQVTMIELDPPTAVTSGTNVIERAADGVRRLALPAVASVERLAQLPKIRLIR